MFALCSFLRISVEEAARHPRFKYFKETGEDSYQSFLGVPLIERGTLQGVLVVQTVERRQYSRAEAVVLVDRLEGRHQDRVPAEPHERLVERQVEFELNR